MVLCVGEEEKKRKREREKDGEKRVLKCKLPSAVARGNARRESPHLPQTSTAVHSRNVVRLHVRHLDWHRP